MAESIPAAVFGKGSLAIRVADWFLRSPDYDLRAIVPVIPEPTWTGSLKDWAGDRNLRVIESGDYTDFLSKDEATRFGGLVFSIFYDKIYPDWFIERCDRVLNIHNAPLPRYRGVNPINWALKNGEDRHGVTIHEITPGIDSGPIVAQLEYSIYPDLDEVADVYARSLAYGWTLFEQTMPLLPKIEARAQDEAEATYYSSADAARLGERRDFTRPQTSRA